MMTLLTRHGQCTLVDACTYPLTGVACVSSASTDVAVFLIDRDAAAADPTSASSCARPTG